MPDAMAAFLAQVWSLKIIGHWASRSRSAYTSKNLVSADVPFVNLRLKTIFGELWYLIYPKFQVIFGA